MHARPGTVITPEAVRLEFSLGGIATRSAAKTIDLLLAAVIIGLLLALGLLGLNALDHRIDLIWGREVWARILETLVVFLGVVFLLPLMEWFGHGRTPGKAAMGLRVITDLGEEVSFRHAMVRGLLQLVEIPTGLGFFVALSNPRQQRLGDLAAGTIVIVDGPPPGHITMIPTVFPTPAGCEDLVARIEVESMTSEQFRLVRDLLLRCDQLTPTARRELTDEAATRLLPIVGEPDDFRVTSERFLNCVASAYQHRYCAYLFDNSTTVAADQSAARPRYASNGPVTS